MNRLDPRQPMVFDTRDLSRRPGTQLDLARTIELDEDFGTEVVAVPRGRDLDVEIRLESVQEGVLVTGVVDARANGACVRCLESVELPVQTRFQELFAYADRAAHHHAVDADSDGAEVYELVDDLIDLRPVLRDAVVTALPFQPVCREDCPGLCAQCGQPLAEDPDHRHETLDPRWAALQALAASRRPHDDRDESARS